MPQATLIDMTGQKFGRFSVLSYAGGRRWLCLCDCGATRLATRHNLLKGRHVSCGCHRNDQNRQRKTHGARNTRAFERWSHIRQRCGNPNHGDFHRYGARGIFVCARWQEFANFLADMGQPQPGQTLERIDNSGPYWPENCRWASRKEQANNTRRNRHLTLNGETLKLHEWAARTGLKSQTLTKRLTRGWSVEKTLTTP